MIPSGASRGSLHGAACLEVEKAHFALLKSLESRKPEVKLPPPLGAAPSSTLRLFLEEDKRATTNVQNGLVFFFLFSFRLFELKQ